LFNAVARIFRVALNSDDRQDHDAGQMPIRQIMPTPGSVQLGKIDNHSHGVPRPYRNFRGTQPHEFSVAQLRRVQG
jgi:hypothetical protein